MTDQGTEVAEPGTEVVPADRGERRARRARAITRRLPDEAERTTRRRVST